jgi:succinate dehydrogenase/fumarate reductase iron-sulfur protein
MDANKHVINVRIKRFNPDTDREPYWQTYEVPGDKVSRLLDIMEYIHSHLDPTLAYRRHYCRDLVCDACFININGTPQMSCMMPLKGDEKEIILEPQEGYVLVRDLVVDFLKEEPD